MKSKKKLIYKLHQNFNQNPYKIVDEISFRNAGVKSYDFNKLKSIRAISLRGDSSQFQTKRNFDERMAYNSNKLGSYEDRDRMVQQRLVRYDQKAMIDEKAVQDRIAQQRKSKGNQQDSHQSILPEKGMQRSQSIKPSRFIGDKLQPNNDFQHNTLDSSTGHKQSLQKSETRPKNPTKHQRNISLPVINAHHQSQPINKTVNVINKRQYMLTFVEEQKAKDLVMKQLGVKNSLSKITSLNENSTNKQQKINNQVLASIKLKSVDNLQRMARSRSQVVIVDKWKQKYGQQQIIKSKKINDVVNKKIIDKQSSKSNAEKYFLPKLKTIQKSEDFENKDQKNDSIVEENKLCTKMENNQKVQTIYSERYEDIIKPYSSTQIPPTQSNSQKKHTFCLNHYLSRQNPRVQRQKDSIITFKQELFSNQPLKINITQVKKHERRNKQNLNQLNNQAQKEKIIANLTSRVQKTQKKTPNSSQNQEVLERVVQNKPQESIELKKQKPNIQISQTEKSNEKIKTFLSFKEFKNDKNQGSINISNSKSKIKLKINEQKMLMQKIIQSQEMIEWQNKRYSDMEQMEFHAFVKHRANQMNED